MSNSNTSKKSSSKSNSSQSNTSQNQVYTPSAYSQSTTSQNQVYTPSAYSQSNYSQNQNLNQGQLYTPSLYSQSNYSQNQNQGQVYTPSLYSEYTDEKAWSEKSGKKGVKAGIKKFFKNINLGEHPSSEYDRRRAEGKGEQWLGNGVVDFGPLGRMPGSGGRL